MYVQIVNFNLKDMNQEEYETLCNQLAPAIASIPGLVSKVWLSDPASNTYGGVYVWNSQQASEAFSHSEIFHDFVNHPSITNITARGFDAMEGPTQVTRGIAQVATK